MCNFAFVRLHAPACSAVASNRRGNGTTDTRRVAQVCQVCAGREGGGMPVAIPRGNMLFWLLDVFIGRQAGLLASAERTGGCQAPHRPWGRAMHGAGIIGPENGRSLKTTQDMKVECAKEECEEVWVPRCTVLFNAGTEALSQKNAAAMAPCLRGGRWRPHERVLGRPCELVCGASLRFVHIHENLLDLPHRINGDELQSQPSTHQVIQWFRQNAWPPHLHACLFILV